MFNGRPSLRVALAALACIALSFAIVGCDGGKKAETASTVTAASATPRALPSAVVYRPDPQGIEIADPTFKALPGAKVEFGRLGGAGYRIEIPDDWNGKLVLYMHGFQSLAPKASIDPPGIRQYLIENGYAWGASSFSSTALIPGRAADETAALWDLFAQKYGRPERTYIMGHSMGGAATNIAAERYGDRYDGALSMCGFAGQSAQTQIVGDYFFAGAYVAGVTQAEFDASTDLPKLVNERIRPALSDPANEKKFEDILISLTGGPRPFDRQGLRAEDGTNWMRADLLVPFRIPYNNDRTYEFGAASGVSSADFNARVVRIAPDMERVTAFNDGNEITGELQLPMLTLHTTGDWQVPIDQEQILRREVDAAGKGDMLVQRVIQAAPHCGFSDGEWIAGFEALVDWVEHGHKPEGENVLTNDLSHAGERFTLEPRFGSDAAALVPGAADRVTVTGTITIDSKPADAPYFWIEVRHNGLRQVCSFDGDPPAGRYARTIAAGTEIRGCGAPGDTVALAVFSDGKMLTARPVPWPVSGHQLTLNADLSSTDLTAAQPSTPVFGKALDTARTQLAPGTIVQAYIGDTLCGESAIPPVVMQFANPESYAVLVSGPDAISGCAKSGVITFRINGSPVAETATNDLELRGHALDLTLAIGD